MMNDPIEQIRELLSREELLCQLAEEASELSQAALKLRRVYDGTNPTPKGRKEAYDNLMEEVADIYLCLIELNFLSGGAMTTIMRIANEKVERWVTRLNKRGAGEQNGEK